MTNKTLRLLIHLLIGLLIVTVVATAVIISLIVIGGREESVISQTVGVL